MMRTKLYAAASLILAPMLGACDSDEPAGNTGPEEERYVAFLSGINEVPAVNSNSAGIARFTVGSDGSITYTVDVNALTSATQAHIHGPAGADRNAGVLVFLADRRTAPVNISNGRLSEGTIQRSVSLPGGMTYDQLLQIIRAGNSYVNVHTTGRPGGEIRGQILRETAP